MNKEQELMRQASEQELKLVAEDLEDNLEGRD
jgi:hypothetical protein